MYFSRLRLENWRNFRKVDVPLTERMFVVGPNASGKSNLLDVFRFLRDIAKPGGGLQSAISTRGGFAKLRSLSARGESTVVIDVETPDWRYSIGFGQTPRGQRHPILKHERVWMHGRLVLDRPNAADVKDELRLTQTNLEQISANSEFRQVAQFVQSVQSFHLVPELLRQPDPFRGLSSPENPLGKSFLQLIAETSPKTRDSHLAQVEQLLKAVLPDLTHLALVQDDSGAAHLSLGFKPWALARQTEDQLSDGTLRLIGIFWSLLEGRGPLLMEEPELSLHSAIIRQFPELFYRLQRKRKRQLLVSTHSPDLLSDKGIGGEEVLLLRPGVTGTTVETAASNLETLHLLQAGLSIADAVVPHSAPNNGQQIDFGL